MPSTWTTWTSWTQAPDELHIEGAHPQLAPGGLAHHGEGLGDQLVEVLRPLPLALLLLPPGQVPLQLVLGLRPDPPAAELLLGPPTALAQQVEVLRVGLAEADIGTLVTDALPEVGGLGGKILVREGAHLVLEGIDPLDHAGVPAQLTPAGIAEDLGEEGHQP